MSIDSIVPGRRDIKNFPEFIDKTYIVLATCKHLKFLKEIDLISAKKKNQYGESGEHLAGHEVH